MLVDNFFFCEGYFDVHVSYHGRQSGGSFRTVSGIVAMLLALVTSSVGVSSLSGFESDGFARGKGKWKLLEGTRAFSDLRSVVFRYGPRDRSGDGGIQAGVFGEHRLFVLAVGRVTCSDVITFVELVCVERMRGVFVRRLPNLRFVD